MRRFPALFSLTLLLTACSDHTPVDSDQVLVRLQTGSTATLDTSSLQGAHVYFDFRVGGMNFDFYPSDIRCDVQGGRFLSATELQNRRVGKDTRTLIGEVRITVHSAKARIRCTDHADRRIPLVVTGTST